MSRPDSAAEVVVKTLKMLGSDIAKEKRIGESLEHHEKISGEDDSSSLNSCKYLNKLLLWNANRKQEMILTLALIQRLLNVSVSFLLISL